MTERELRWAAGLALCMQAASEGGDAHTKTHRKGREKKKRKSEVLALFSIFVITHPSTPYTTTPLPVSPTHTAAPP